MRRNKSPYDLSDGVRGWAELAESHRRVQEKIWGKLYRRTMREWRKRKSPYEL